MFIHANAKLARKHRYMEVCSIHMYVICKYNMRMYTYAVATDAASDARCFAPRDQPCIPCKAGRRKRARDARRIAR